MTEPLTDHHRALCREAIHGALHALMAGAASRGRGWYHFLDGELVASTRLMLDGEEEDTQLMRPEVRHGV